MKKYLVLIVIALFLLSGCGPSEAELKAAQDAAKLAQQKAKAAEAEAKAAQEALKQVETCDDGTKNQDEEDIDCGGVCSACPDTSKDVIGEKTKQATEIKEIIQYEIPSDKLSQLKAKLTQGTKATLLTNSYPSGLGVGDSYVFAFGLTNMNQQEEEFKFYIRFKEAKDSFNNAITGADATTIEKWFDENNLQNIKLDTYKQEFIPIGVTVGEEIGPGVSTAAGNYVFELETRFKHGGGYDDYDKRDFTFRVK